MGRLQILGSILNSIKKRLGLASSNSTEITNFIPVSENPTNYLPGLKFVEVADDGNCFYYAIAQTLNAETQLHHNELRKMVANFWQDSSKHTQLAPIIQANLADAYQKELEDTKEQLNIIHLCYDTPEEIEKARKELTEKNS